jgi:tetratricopeptide (TPR) repeat protein
MWMSSASETITDPGYAAFQAGDFDKAVELWTQDLTRQPTPYQSWANLLYAMYQIQDLSRARELLTDPEFADLHKHCQHALGLQFYRDVGLRDLEEKCLANWTDIDPDQRAVAERRLQWIKTNGVDHLIETGAAKPIRVVALGEQCLPWTVLNRWGLRPSFWKPEDRLPFNLAYNWVNSVAKALEADFAGYDSLKKLRAVETPSGGRTFTNAGFGVVYNHQAATFWHADSGARLASDITARIANFRAMLEEPLVLFVYARFSSSDVDRLANAIGKMREGDKPWRLLVLDFFQGAPATTELAHVELHRVAYPRDDYQWFEPAEFDSQAGFDFELSVAEVVRDSILSLSREVG